MSRTNLIPRLLPEDEFIRGMAGSAEALAMAVSSGTLFFVVRDGRKLYPSFFIDRTKNEGRHLAAVMKHLAGVDDLAKWLFFTTPKGSLGAMTPLEAMQRRRFAAVKRTAEGFAQR